jgi:LAO/AO transport system kinase
LIAHLRAAGDEVAVLAVDPSSPFTGGAILGDRVRMQDHATDPGVFIRSMATRGHLGGLSLATPEAIRLLDALGHRWIIVETVGVGQVEVEVAGKADTTVVVVNPGWGDSVQANKAGLMEVADVFAINKADRPGVEQTKRDLEQMLELSGEGAALANAGWNVPIIPTVGARSGGIATLWDAVTAHRDHATATGVLERRRRFRLGEELREIVARRLEQRAREVCTGDRWDALTEDVLAREIDPWSAADAMLAAVDA